MGQNSVLNVVPGFQISGVVGQEQERSGVVDAQLKNVRRWYYAVHSTSIHSPNFISAQRRDRDYYRRAQRQSRGSGPDSALHGPWSPADR